MASGPAAETILFIGAIVTATAVVGVLGLVVQDLSGGMRVRGGSLAKEYGTDIAVINDPMEVTVAPLTLFVKNVGGSTLASSLTNVFLDGAMSGSPTYDVLGAADDSVWRPGDVLKITAPDLAVASGDHRVRVVAETGISADLQFHQA
jgi:archaellum component FlaG (FlaF/FlaG flagellin family)